jgi:hypothetical protein
MRELSSPAAWLQEGRRPHHHTAMFREAATIADKEGICSTQRINLNSGDYVLLSSYLQHFFIP